MSIPTDVILESSFNVLEPQDVAPAGSPFEAYVESGSQQIGPGDQTIDVVFDTAKATAAYMFDQLIIRNTVDGTPFVGGYTVTDKTVDGFQLTLSFTPDTGNYYLDWKVRIPTALTNGVQISATVAGTTAGTVKHFSAVANDGLTQVVTNPTELPTLTLGIADGGIALSKLAQTPVTGEVLTPSNTKTVTNKSLDGNNNTFSNIPFTALSNQNGVFLGDLGADPGNNQMVIWDSGLGAFRFMGTPTQRGIVKDVYISARTDGKAGTGTAEDPFNGSSTSLFDALMLSFQGTTNINFYFSPGVFTTKGRLVWHCNSGWSWYLTPATTIKMDVLSAGEATSLGNVACIFNNTSVASSVFVDDILIDGGIWDLNMDNQTQPLTAGIIGVYCDGFTFRNAKVIGFASTNGTESFTVFAGGNGSASKVYRKGQLVENCEFTANASVTNTGVLTICNIGASLNVANATSISNGWCVGVTLRHCFFHDIIATGGMEIACVNGGNWASDVRYHHNRFENITGNNGCYAYYRDTGSVINMQIDSDQISNVPSPIDFNSDSTSLLENVSISNEVMTGVTFNPIRIIHDTSKHGTNLTIADNYIKGSINAGIQITYNDSARLKNNVVAVTSNWVTSTGTTFISPFNNRKGDGSPITIDTLDTALVGLVPGALQSVRRNAGNTAFEVFTPADTTGYPTLAANNVFTGTAEWDGGDGSKLVIDPDGGGQGINYLNLDGNTLLQVDPNGAGLTLNDNVLVDAAINVGNASGFHSAVKSTNLTGNLTHQLPDTAGTLMVGANNLSEITAAATARSNIGMAAQTTTGQTSGFTAGVGTAVLSDSTFTGGSGTKAFTIGDIVKHLKAVGILAAS